jgi:hypothetical protein
VLIAASPAPLTVVRAVRVDPERSGVTRVEVDTGDPRVPYRYRQYSDLDGAPRGVLRLRGVTRSLAGDTIPIHDSNLEQIRIGLHPELEPPELHLVFDLTDRRVTVLSITRELTTLVIHVGRPGGTPTPGLVERSVSPTPATASAPPPPPAPPSAALTPTATPTPTAMPSPTPTPTASPTAVPAPPPTRPAAHRPPPTPSSPPPRAPRTLFRLDETAPPPDTVSGPTPIAITEMVVSTRADGSTMLRVSADEALPRHAILDYGDPRDPSRHVLLLLGVRATAAPSLLEVDGDCLRAIQIASAGAGRPAETQLGLVLASSRVRVTKVTTQGRHLVVVLAPPESDE